MSRLAWSALPTLVVAVSPLALVACGSSGGGSTGSAASGLQFAQCMRAHGVTSFPDPGSPGKQFIGPQSGIDPQSPVFQSAQKACARFGPGGPIAIHMSEAQKLAALRFARCMRAHGEPNFPDPTFSPPSSSGPIIALRGMFFPVGSGMDPRSPAFQQAAAACGINPPAGGHRQFQSR